MLDTKTRNEILLEEKIAKIDDINFDKIYDVEEFAAKQIENYDEMNANSGSNEILFGNDFSNSNEFEMELGTNEFLDNFLWNGEEEKSEKSKFKLNFNHKFLLFTFTSIIALLSILLIYNVFVINSLSNNLKNAQILKVENTYGANVNYQEISGEKVQYKGFLSGVTQDSNFEKYVF